MASCGGGDTFFGGEGTQRLHEALVLVQVFGLKAREMSAEIARPEGMEPLNRPRESTP